eukprot:m51a1_g1746 hypothetical protein (187) ;mRNA; f:197709-198605
MHGDRVSGTAAGAQFPHGLIVECEALGQDFPDPRPLYGAVAVVGRPVSVSRSREVVAAATPLPGYAGQVLSSDRKQSLAHVRPEDVEVEAVGHTLRTCADWGSCLLLRPDSVKRSLGLSQVGRFLKQVSAATVPVMQTELGWTIYGDILDTIASALNYARHVLSSGHFQGHAFNWEDLSNQEPEES